MPEGLHTPERIVEVAEDSRKEELRAKMKLLDDARSRILFDAGQRVLTKQEKKAIMRWMKRGGKEEEWPLDDNITVENYQARLAPYGVADLIDTRHITGKNDIYNLVTRQYVQFLQELQTITPTPTPEPTPAPTPEPTPAPEIPKIVEMETKESVDPEKRAASWRVWEMLMAMLHAMQKYPDQFEALRGLPPNELNKKLSEEGPKLLQEYIRVATRGEMEWSNEKEMWDVLDQTKLTNLDVKVGIFVLQKAGFDVKIDAAHLELVPPGTEAKAKPFVLQFDTMNTPKRKALEASARKEGSPLKALQIETSESPASDLKEGEYRITVDHHTNDPKDRKTSAAELLYNYIWIAGGIEQPDPVLERLLAFTNAHDNGEFPADKEFFRRSANTLWGIASDNQVPADVLYRIMARGRNPKDALTEEDLDENIGKDKKVRDLVTIKRERNEHGAQSFDRWADLGYIVETDYGPLFVCLEVPGRYMPKQIAARAWGGVPNILIWSPKKHSFFIALGGGKTFDPGTIFPQDGTEIIRGQMAIFKRQIKSPAELTATLKEILDVLSKKKKRHLTGDLYDYVEKNITRDTTLETLYSIYTTAPEKQEEVIKMLLQWPADVLNTIQSAIKDYELKSKRVSHLYQQIYNRVKTGLLARTPKKAAPPLSPRIEQEHNAKTMSLDDAMAILATPDKAAEVIMPGPPPVEEGRRSKKRMEKPGAKTKKERRRSEDE